jgi:biopolymer transport protein ExbB
MSLTERLLAFTLLGSEWVLWLLLMLSVLSVAVMVERALTLPRRPPDLAQLSARLLALLAKGDLASARDMIGQPRTPEARVGLVGLGELSRGREAASEAMASAKSRERLLLEKHLGILGTLGNNAPFIGLFGTVLGIIRAFADLAKDQGGGAAVVMAGISEALVATAVGLLVAIPAVVAFNLFQGRVRRTMGRIDAMAHLILSAATPADRPTEGAAAKSSSGS